SGGARRMSVIDRLYEAIRRPVPARPVGFVRIVVGAAALLRAWEGVKIMWPLTRPEILRLPNAEWAPEPTPALVIAVLVVWVAAALAFTLGLRTRAAGGVLFIVLGVVLLSDQQAYSNHLSRLALLVLLLTVGDAGAAMSLDSRVSPRETVPAGPILLMKAQISIVYGFAALTKLNAGFLGGGVLAAQLGTGFVPVPDGLRVPVVMMTLAGLVVVLEAFLALGLWSRRYRPAALVLGLAFHVSIVLLMDPAVQLVVFALEMLAVYLLFLDLQPSSREVVFDDECGFCSRIVAGIRALDWLRVHRFVGSSETAELERLSVSHEEALTSVQLVSPTERAAGFAALGNVAERLPISFLWAPLHRLVGGPGERFYRIVAERRRCRRKLVVDRIG
ncbi:MAG: HTTM domain-containing protein, partial [Acidimicrobiia bacterium]